jgi:beta-lactamase class D
MFWLQGPLKISAIEQARFMAALASKTLPLADDIQSTVGEIIRVDEGDDWSLHAKTGWGTIENPAIGWWAGWVEKQGTIYGFALNMDMPDVADAPKRISLGKSSLRILEVLP